MSVSGERIEAIRTGRQENVPRRDRKVSVMSITTFPNYRQISKVVRAKAKATGTPYPIEDKDGFAAPKLVGKSYHYTTRTGLPVYHPSAYARKGWSSLVYHGSTLRIVVGRGWLISKGLV